VRGEGQVAGGGGQRTLLDLGVEEFPVDDGAPHRPAKGFPSELRLSESPVRHSSVPKKSHR